MDPLSITASCIGITAGIATLTERISAFVSSVREARKDLDAIRRELGSLQLSLSALSDEDARFGFDRTPGLRENLLGVVENCGGIVGEIGEVLEDLEGEGGKMGMGKKMKWATSGKGQMLKLRQGLEAHKSALDIALDLIAISITADIKQDTSVLRDDTGKIKEDTDNILLEIGNLQCQVAKLDLSNDERGFLMKRFLAESVTYAESVAEMDQLEGSDGKLTERAESPSIDEERQSPHHLVAPTSPPGRGASPNTRSPNHYWSSLPQKEKDALLLEAAEHGNLRRITLLLESGANIDARNNMGSTSVYVVILNKSYTCLQLLLESGANINDIDPSHPGHGFYRAFELADLKAMKTIMDNSSHNPEFQPHFEKILFGTTTNVQPLPNAVALQNWKDPFGNGIELIRGALIQEVRFDSSGYGTGWMRGTCGRFHSRDVKLIDAAKSKELMLNEPGQLPARRLWMTGTNNLNIMGRFVGMVIDRIVLREDDGDIIKVRLEKLSFQDLDYLESEFRSSTQSPSAWHEDLLLKEDELKWIQRRKTIIQKTAASPSVNPYAAWHAAEMKTLDSGRSDEISVEPSSREWSSLLPANPSAYRLTDAGGSGVHFGTETERLRPLPVRYASPRSSPLSRSAQIARADPTPPPRGALQMMKKAKGGVNERDNLPLPPRGALQMMNNTKGGGSVPMPTSGSTGSSISHGEQTDWAAWLAGSGKRPPSRSNDGARTLGEPPDRSAKASAREGSGTGVRNPSSGTTVFSEIRKAFLGSS